MSYNWKSKEQRIAAQNNLRRKLNQENKEGKEMRKCFLRKTGNKKFEEKRFQKNVEQGKTYSRREVAGALNKVKREENKKLRREYNRLKKEGKVKTTFSKFKKTNETPDLVEIQESFNSPT